MPYLSLLLDRPVLDPEGREVGRVQDLLTRVAEPFPAVAAILVRGRDGVKRAGWDSVATVDELGARLHHPYSGLPPWEDNASEVALRADLLDRQIVDTHGTRVVRVNDIQLQKVDRDLRVSGVDVGSSGLLRRLGLEGAGRGVARALGRELKDNVIPWDVVEPLDLKNLSQIRLSVPRRKIDSLHPVDLAELLTDLRGRERLRLFHSLGKEQAAEALQEMDEDVQVLLLNSLPARRAAEILEEMDPDEAADLLAELVPDRREHLLSLMEQDEARELAGLLGHEEGSAGGLMTTEFIALPEDLPAQATIERLRELAPDAETIYYLYVVDPEEKLTGVLSLRDLIVAPPETPVGEIAIREPVRVRADADFEEVAELVDRYGLLALPVVSADEHLLGIVTMDDVMERVLPESWRKRRSRWWRG